MNDEVELIDTRIGMMAEISVDGAKKLVVAVIREIGVQKYNTNAQRYTGFVSTSYYYHGETAQIEDFWVILIYLWILIIIIILEIMRMFLKQMLLGIHREQRYRLVTVVSIYRLIT